MFLNSICANFLSFRLLVNATGNSGKGYFAYNHTASQAITLADSMHSTIIIVFFHHHSFLSARNNDMIRSWRYPQIESSGKFQQMETKITRKWWNCKTKATYNLIPFFIWKFNQSIIIWILGAKQIENFVLELSIWSWKFVIY